MLGLYFILKSEKMKVLVTQLYPTLCNPMDYIARQVPLSMRFSRHEYWSGLPFPFLGDLPDSGIEPASSALQADSLYHLSHQGSPLAPRAMGKEQGQEGAQPCTCWRLTYKYLVRVTSRGSHNSAWCIWKLNHKGRNSPAKAL